jgi:hypothetical protein
VNWHITKDADTKKQEGNRANKRKTRRTNESKNIKIRTNGDVKDMENEKGNNRKKC